MLAGCQTTHPAAVSGNDPGSSQAFLRLTRPNHAGTYSFRMLSLTLLVLGVFADHAHHPTAVDDLALVANLLY